MEKIKKVHVNTNHKSEENLLHAYKQANLLTDEVRKSIKSVCETCVVCQKYKRSQIDSFEIVHTDRTYGDQFQIMRRPYQPLQIVQIYFDTATYDNIIRDVSVTLADQLGAIGGTMGLFAGFSFLSALEIIYYVVKYLISLVNRKINV